VGTIRTITLLVVLGAARMDHGVAMATSGRLAQGMGMAKKCQTRGRVEESCTGTHRLCIHSSYVAPTSRLQERDKKAMSPPECVGASRQEVTGTLDATGQSEANGKCTHM